MIELSRRAHPNADGIYGQVAVVTLCRPPVNAIDDSMISAFHRILDELATQSDWQVLHIRSSQKVFAAGADLALIRSWQEAPSPATALTGYVERLQGLYQRIEDLPQVTFCEIAGAAMGGGLELALSCDVRMAAEEAKLGLPEVGIGLIPGAGGTQRLTRLCGRGIASRLILGCESVDGRTAASLGLVEWAVPRATLEQHAISVADRLGASPEHSQRVAKQCIAAFGKEALDGYRLEREAGSALLNTNRTQQLISAFLDKTPAK
jgi:enoyl-CoA hydratase